VLKPGVHDTTLFINLGKLSIYLGKLSIYLERDERDYGRYVDERLLQAESWETAVRLADELRYDDIIGFYLGSEVGNVQNGSGSSVCTESGGTLES
jgi:hypothetical protein